MADTRVSDEGFHQRLEWSDLPNPPTNVFIATPYQTGALQIIFDDPSILPENSKFQIVGTNIWRAFDSPEGPYTKINSTPLNILNYRDQIQEELVENENVSDNFISFGTNTLGEFIFKTNKNPIVKPGKSGPAHMVLPGWNGAPTSDPADVTVTIDGKQAFVKNVNGLAGEVTLITSPVFDTAQQKLIQYPVPVAGSVVLATYSTVSNLVLTALHQRVYYKVTSVDVNNLETPLDRVEAKTFWQTNNLSYIWREAIRRNRWILQQGGERVLLFIKKRIGPRCYSTDPVSEENFNNHLRDCLICYGTGIRGGYEGPFEIEIAPPESAKNLDLSERGLRLNWVYETWTGPYPLINQRDFIIRKDSTRMKIGKVTQIYDSGAILQQEFTVESADQSDIIYRVPVVIPLGRDGRPAFGSEFVTDKHEVEDGREQRGRTRVYENITY